MNRLKKICLVSILGASLLLYIASYRDAQSLKEELFEFADGQASAYGQEKSPGYLEVAEPQITVARRFILFGPATGKVTLYVRTQEDAESSVADAVEQAGYSHGGISGIDYFLARVDGTWTLTESSTCSSERCRLDGAKVFASARY